MLIAGDRAHATPANTVVGRITRSGVLLRRGCVSRGGPRSLPVCRVGGRNRRADVRRQMQERSAVESLPE